MIDLTDLLPPAAIRLDAHVNDWREALQAVGHLLVATDTATPRYTQAMIDNLEKKMVLTSSSPLDLHWPMPDRTPQCCGQACRGYVLTNRWHSAMRRTIL
ncbi:phosphotransferase system protein [Cutibacterium acnes JCM 18918]|nr:phosphotransferase system protein [Cutibacterium acnes JCM 18918]